MSTATPRSRPNAFEYVTYCYGRRLPDSMKQWVAVSPKAKVDWIALSREALAFVRG